MGHHGLLTAADTVALAFDLHYYFEQVIALRIECVRLRLYPPYMSTTHMK